MTTAFFSFLTLFFLGGLVFILRKKQLHLWIGSYLGQLVFSSEKPVPSEPVHILFCLADHFEPQWNQPALETERRRVDEWTRCYPQLAAKHRDADGRPPQHTFFYPGEEYRPEHLEKLSDLCRQGFGEVEIHLHHGHDTAEGFREKIEKIKSDFVRHGLLNQDQNGGSILFGFIHGNWALDNSCNDPKWCGVNNELEVLKETGCYADFTLPSAPSEAQTKKINAIYYATDDPERPKSHDTGVDVEAGKEPNGDLMIVQGPLTLNWRRRKGGIFPRIENGEIAWGNPPMEARVDLWIKQRIHVKGKPNWIFVKVYTHGAQEENFDCLLGEPMDRMFSYLEGRYNDGRNYQLHYVNAREMYNIIKAAEAGFSGNPTEYRDWLLATRVGIEREVVQ